jgi:EAL domain-containing protein (putative c-di-GMP-specific phosphodiesterase class I)
VVREACSGFVSAGSTRVWPVVTTGLRDLDATPVEVLLAEVRQTAFEADRRFPGGVRWHDPRATDQPASRALTLTTDLADALDAPQDQLWLAFQPVRDLRTGRVTAVEALLRWQHPTLGPVPPTEAVAVAEASGLVLPLGAWVLHRALEQAATWWAAHRFVTAHVNVSPVELRDPSYADAVSRALRRHDLPPSALLLELTETDLMVGDREVRETLHRLRTLGVRLGIDDFGSGWSSIGQLLDLPVDTVKVDRSLTSRIDRSPADLDLLRAVLGLLDTAPMEVVVEGIENPAQASLLRNLGVRFGQGYHLGRPVPAAELSLGGGAVRRTSA